jgi:branched-chain amino acid transport system substrate-binding protein
MRKLFVFLFSCFLFLPFNVKAEEPIKIGDISAYTGQAHYAEPYKKGWELALEEINGQGGVLGRPIEVISRDSKGSPPDAINVAQDLIHIENVFAMMGPIFSHVGLALSEVAAREKVPLITAISGTDKLLWEKYHPYIFRIHSGTYQFVSMMLAETKHLKAKRWATVLENYEAGHAFFDEFSRQIKAQYPDVEFVETQYPALHKMNAGAVVQALKKANPDAIFVFLLGKNMSAFVREMKLRGLDHIPVVNPTLGLPIEQKRLGDELPQGWITLGPPSYDQGGKAYQQFWDVYQEKYNEEPDVMSAVGYLALKSIASAIEKAGSLDREAFITAMTSDHFPFFNDKPFYFRELDHQSSMAWSVGKTAVIDGQPTMIDKVLLNPEDHFASDSWVLQQREEK